MALKRILVLLPFIYGAVGIVLPIYRMDHTSYLLSVFLLFWLPSLLMLGIHASWMKEKNLLKPFRQVNIYMAIVAWYFEFSAMGMGLWTFNKDRLLHITFYGVPVSALGVPIEEFLYWYGATPFCLLCYITFYRIVNMKGNFFGSAKEKGVAFPALGQFAYLAAGAIFLPLSVFIYGQIKKSKVVCWPAIVMTIIMFYVFMALMEAHCVGEQYWIYAAGRSLTIIQNGFFKGVAVEEFFQYYILGPLFVALFFHFMDLGPAFTFKGSTLMPKASPSDMPRVQVPVERGI